MKNIFPKIKGMVNQTTSTNWCVRLLLCVRGGGGETGNPNSIFVSSFPLRAGCHGMQWKSNVFPTGHYNEDVCCQAGANPVLGSN